MKDAPATTVRASDGIMDDMLSACRCCKHCREQTAIDRLMQIEPAEAPLQPAILTHAPNNLLQRQSKR